MYKHGVVILLVALVATVTAGTQVEDQLTASAKTAVAVGQVVQSTVTASAMLPPQAEAVSAVNQEMDYKLLLSVAERQQKLATGNVSKGGRRPEGRGGGGSSRGGRPTRRPSVPPSGNRLGCQTFACLGKDRKAKGRGGGLRAFRAGRAGRARVGRTGARGKPKNTRRRKPPRP